MAAGDRQYKKFKGFKWTVGNEDVPALALVVDQISRQLHICEPKDVGTDWNVANDSHPSVYIHSATTPETNYIKMYHDSSNGIIEVNATTVLTMSASAWSTLLPLTITQATLGNDGRAIKIASTSATPAMNDGYGIVEIDCTISGTATGWFSPLSSWVNITGSGEAGTGGYICAQQNGVFADAGANTSSTIIFGMRASALLTDAPSVLCPFSLNTANRSITAVFSIAAGPSIGISNGSPSGGADGTIPIACNADGTGVRYIWLYPNPA